MSQTSVTIARRTKSELESGEGSWFADENGDKSPCGCEGAQQPVNFHFLVLYLFFPFLVTQKSHLKSNSKYILQIGAGENKRISELQHSENEGTPIT